MRLLRLISMMDCKSTGGWGVDGEDCGGDQFIDHPIFVHTGE